MNVTIPWPWFRERFGPWSCTVWSFQTVHRSWTFTVLERSWAFSTVYWAFTTVLRAFSIVSWRFFAFMDVFLPFIFIIRIPVERLKSPKLSKTLIKRSKTLRNGQGRWTVWNDYTVQDHGPKRSQNHGLCTFTERPCSRSKNERITVPLIKCLKP